MSYIDYRWAIAQIGGWRSDDLDQQIKRQTKGDPPFYGVIMLAMQRADTINLGHLRRAWPTVYDELHARYNAPGAIIDTDPPGLVAKVAESLGVTPAALGRTDAATGDDHSASRRLDVLEQEAPHLIDRGDAA